MYDIFCWLPNKNISRTFLFIIPLCLKLTFMVSYNCFSSHTNISLYIFFPSDNVFCLIFHYFLTIFTTLFFLQAIQTVSLDKWPVCSIKDHLHVLHIWDYCDHQASTNSSFTHCAVCLLCLKPTFTGPLMEVCPPLDQLYDSL